MNIWTKLDNISKRLKLPLPELHGLLLSIFVFAIVLMPRDLQFLKYISVLARYNATYLIPVISVIFILILSIPNQKISNLLIPAFIFLLFALALNGLWSSAYTENYVISGLIPRSDAFSIYTGSLSFLETGYIENIASRRPIYGAFLATLLSLTNGHLQVTLAILALISALSLLISVQSIKTVFGNIPAVIFFIVQFLFIRRYVGITMTENMGFILGNFAFSLFMISILMVRQEGKHSRTVFLIALFVFTLSQMARPGAVATLPLLIFFFAVIYRIKQKISWENLLLALIIVIFGILLNSLLFQLYNENPGVSQNNMGYGLYGLAVGGKGWEQIFIDHPEITKLPAGMRERYIFSIIWELITKTPGGFFEGMIKQFRVLFSFQPTNSLYSFLYSSNNEFSKALISLVFALNILAIIYVFFKWRKPVNKLIIIFLLGFLASLFVAPAYQTQYMRVYAASIPLFGILPTIGLASLLQQLKIRDIGKPTPIIENESRKYKIYTQFISILTLIIIIPPLFLKLPKTIPQAIPGLCDHGQQQVIIDYMPGASIYIFKNTPERMTWVPFTSQLDYKKQIHNICCGDEIDYFNNLPLFNFFFIF